MNDVKQARTLIEAAARDLTTVRLMANNTDFPDENFGFNVQQGAEKLCKAWLSLLGEIYPLTHDLGYLLDRLIRLNAEAGNYRILATYTPFAVEFRYTGEEVVPPNLDRAEAVRHLESLMGLIRRKLDQLEGV